ncbi:MAG: hypothetical protein ACK5HT_01250, partial [Draconibacterium sp.]
GIYVPPEDIGVDESKATTSLNIPLGFGFKFNVGKRMSIGTEFVVRKYFKDTMDNIDDPRTYLDSNGQPVGYTSWMHNNDWTFNLGVFVCYQIYRSGRNCVIYD